MGYSMPVFFCAEGGQAALEGRGKRIGRKRKEHEKKISLETIVWKNLSLDEVLQNVQRESQNLECIMVSTNSAVCLAFTCRSVSLLPG